MLLGAATTLILLAAPAAPAGAQELEVSGSVAGEPRFFAGEPLQQGQLEHAQPSFVVEPEFLFGSADRRHRFKVSPLFRLDGADTERTHFDLREAYWRGIFGDWEILVGFNVVFWGVTESRHLVNMINQTDFLEDVDEEDKLGQPMVSVEWQRSWGRISGFLLLGFRERRFPGAEGRLRFPLPIDYAATLFPDGRRAIDLALRYSHFFGDFDLGVYFFHGTGREPAFVRASGLPEGTEADSRERDGDPRPARFVPLYRTINQVGMDLQYTRDAWLWKVETIVREGEGDTFGALVGGFEYTLYQVFGSAADLGLLGEYLWDGRDPTAPPTAFDNDAFAGVRLALNDVQDTQVLAGAIVDLEDGTIAARIEAARRLAHGFSMEVEARIFANVAQGNLLTPLRQDSFVNLRLAYSF